MIIRSITYGRKNTISSGSCRSFLVIIIYAVLLCHIVVVESAETTSTTKTKTSKPKATTLNHDTVFRHDHLDYLDVTTLQYYITFPTTNHDNNNNNNNRSSVTSVSSSVSSSSLDYDVAIMFYAQWSSHCHTLAPMWDQISRVLRAGTKESKVIIGLFDCEDTTHHESICRTLNIDKYPTLAYFSMAGNDHYLSKTVPHHVTKFNGNWQYGDALLDWIRTMVALSQWHRSSSNHNNKWGEQIRNTIFKFGNQDRTKTSRRSTDALPVGVPASISNTLEIQSLREEMNQTVSMAVRTSAMMNVLLLPVQEKKESGKYPILQEYGKNYTDMYAMLQELDAWTSSITTTTSTTTTTSSDDDYNHIVIRTCVTELTTDYCDRISTQFMELWIDQWPIHQPVTDAVFDLYQQQMEQYFNNTEPHCQYVQDSCIVSNFTNSLCQPNTCPFVDRMACRYLTACLSKPLQLEYVNALGLIQQQQQPTTSTKKTEPKKGGFSWGL